MNVVQSIVKDQNHLRANVDQLAYGVLTALETFLHNERLRRNDECRAIAGSENTGMTDENSDDILTELMVAYECVQLLAARLGIVLPDVSV